ncbi:MAG TPA: hypothetical protein VGR89_11060 [Puia sp.]|nr:hypothetical protein [Puia sp.]
MDDEQEEEFSGGYSDEDYRMFLLEGASLIAPTAFRIPPARCNCEGKLQLLTEEVSKLRDTLPLVEQGQTWPVVGAVCLGLGFLLGRWMKKWKP